MLYFQQIAESFWNINGSLLGALELFDWEAVLLKVGDYRIVQGLRHVGLAV